jgi:hypothetical protein
MRALDGFGVADPIHSEVPEISARRVPTHQIPQGRQDQHGLRFDPFRIAICKLRVDLLQKCSLEGWQKSVGAVPITP